MEKREGVTERAARWICVALLALGVYLLLKYAAGTLSRELPSTTIVFTRNMGTTTSKSPTKITIAMTAIITR